MRSAFFPCFRRDAEDIRQGGALITGAPGCVPRFAHQRMILFSWPMRASSRSQISIFPTSIVLSRAPHPGSRTLECFLKSSIAPSADPFTGGKKKRSALRDPARPQLTGERAINASVGISPHGIILSLRPLLQGWRDCGPLISAVRGPNVQIRILEIVALGRTAKRYLCLSSFRRYVDAPTAT